MQVVEVIKRNRYESLTQGLGIVGLIFGVIAMAVAFIPCFGIFAIVPGIFALVVSIIGLVVAAKYDNPKGLLIAALIVSIIGCAVVYAQIALVGAVVDESERRELHDERLEPQEF